MARAPTTFRQSDVTRALKATLAAGLRVRRIEIDKDRIIVIPGTVGDQVGEPVGDADDLDRELDEFKNRHP